MSCRLENRTRNFAFLGLGLLVLVVVLIVSLRGRDGSPDLPVHFHRMSDKYLLHWQVDHAKQRIQLTFTVETLGFAGFGLSPKGGMKNSDMIIFGVHDDTGKPYLTDYYGRNTNTFPLVDKEQSWELIQGSQNETHTVVTVARDWDTCDEQDQIIQDVTTRVIWTIGPTDNPQYHGPERGTESINLLDPFIENVDRLQFDRWNVPVEATLDGADTMYWCTVQKTPANYTTKRYIAGFEAHLPDEVARRYSHHLLFTLCVVERGSEEEKRLDEVAGTGGYCYKQDDTKIMSVRHLCRLMIYPWAVGSGPLFFPDNMAMPLNEDGGATYVLTEFHFDNPHKESGIRVQTGVNVYTTDKPREFEAGVLKIGFAVSPTLIIPPSSKDFIISGHCGFDCTAEKFPPEGIRIIARAAHSHLAGRKALIRHFRPKMVVNENGVEEKVVQELPWILKDDNYDFDYQQHHMFREHLVVLPGDQITTECLYDTTWREPPSATLGGLSTRKEMCEGFIWYYSRMANLTACQSYFPVEDLANSFGFTEVNTFQDARNFDPIVTAPESMNGKSMSIVLNTMVNWTTEFNTEFQRRIRYDKHTSMCVNPSGRLTPNLQTIGQHLPVISVGYPQNYEEYIPPPRTCEKKKHH